PGPPYPDPGAFEGWLTAVLGGEREVLLIGLTADRCVLATAQELTYRGYKVYVLEEGVDTSSGKEEEKRRVLHNVPFTHWAEAVSWVWAERQFCEKSD
ncbi:MAG: isochorismatase family protein, partial [Thermoplasmata archaeon]|nr:isochorismatase family protein [Thermoplasmata archaeon]